MHWVTRLIDYGKGGVDAELDGMTLGQIADKIEAEVRGDPDA
jgi:hypothetical protein